MARARRPYLAVVRRGEMKVFRFLQEHFEDTGLIDVIWDRRTVARRGGRGPVVVERRRRERRRSPPDTWSALGFVLVRRRHVAR